MCFSRNFKIVLVVISLQTRDGLESAFEFGGPHLRAAEEITVGKGNRRGHAQVARRVGAFQLGRNAVHLVRLQRHVAVQPPAVGLLHAYDGIAQGLEVTEIAVARTHVVLIIAVAGQEFHLGIDDVGTQLS